MGIWYATREQVKGSLEIAYTARADMLIDDKLEAASRSLEGFLHRRFYPELRTFKKDWPNHQSGNTWQLWLDDDLISLTSLFSGGVNIPTGNLLLRRGDDIDEPPYSYIEINLATSSAFGGGLTYQQSIVGVGVIGYSDTQTITPGGVLGGNIDTLAATLVINPSSGYYSVGVGSLVRIGTERLVLIDRRMSNTGQTSLGVLDSLKSGVTVSVTDGSLFALGETILIGAERMRIDDIAGNTLIVARAWDGTALASHSVGASIFALRTFLARRSVLGSTVTAHTAGDSVFVHEYPGLITELCIAETVVLLEQNASGYARMVGSGASQRESVGKGLEDIRDRAWAAYGRKGRKAAI